MKSTAPKVPYHIQGEGANALASTLKLAFKSLRVLMVILSIFYLFSNFVVLDSNEKAFVLRFGELVGETRSEQIKVPGKNHFVLPKPIGEVVRIPTEKARVISVSFWYDDNVFSDELKNETLPEYALVGGIDGSLLTGDCNIVHTRWSLNFIVEDPVQFYHHYLDPDAAIQHVLSNIVLKETAAAPIENMLYHGSEQLRERIEQRVKRKLKQLNVGVAVNDSLKIFYDQSEVPRQVIQSFNDVVEAEQTVSQTLSEAKTYSEATIQKAHGESARVVSDALGYQRHVLASTQADAEYFASLLPKFRLAPRTMLFALYQQTLEDVLANAKEVYLVNDDQEIRISTNRLRKSKSEQRR